MGIHFQIQYEGNPFGMFFTGQVVRGAAIVKLDESVPVKGVTLRVRGYAKVRWSETSSTTNSDGTTSSSSDTHSDEINYFDTVTECIDTKGLECNLDPGVHTYEFECPLPIDCPSSFKGNYGRVHYAVKITLVRPRKFNKSYSMGFNVVNIVDLNHSSNLMIPTNMEVFKTFCCGPCKSKPLILCMDLPQTGYVPGEFVHVLVRLFNHSFTRVQQLRIALNLIACYRVRTRVSTKSEKIAIARSRFIVTENDHFEIKDKIQVPPTPPTCEDLCEIIKITYEVEIIAKLKAPHISPSVSIPITIGNIPLVAGSTHISEETLIANLRHATPDRESNLKYELPPPSYEEAVYMEPFGRAAPQKDGEDTYFERYLPRYPVYSAQFPYLGTQDRQ